MKVMNDLSRLLEEKEREEKLFPGYKKSLQIASRSPWQWKTIEIGKYLFWILFDLALLCTLYDAVFVL